MPLIKRYPNRKLYDMEAKQYVTLEQIAQIIRDGQDVQVVDHESGDDLTNLTLSQIIFEQAKKKSGFLPQAILTSLIRTGGGTLEYLRRALQSGVQVDLLDPAEEAGQSRLERMQEWVSNGEISPAPGEAQRTQVGAFLAPDTDELGLMTLLDERLVGILHRLNIPTYSELQVLQEQLSELTEKLETVLDEPAQRSLPPHGDDSIPK